MYMKHWQKTFGGYHLCDYVIQIKTGIPRLYYIFGKYQCIVGSRCWLELLPFFKGRSQLT